MASKDYNIAKKTVQDEILAAVGNVAQQEDVQEIKALLGSSGENIAFTGGNIEVMGFSSFLYNITPPVTYGKYFFANAYDEIPVFIANVNVGRGDSGVGHIERVDNSGQRYSLKVADKVLGEMFVENDGFTVTITQASTSSACSTFAATLTFLPKLK